MVAVWLVLVMLVKLVDVIVVLVPTSEISIRWLPMFFAEKNGMFDGFFMFFPDLMVDV